MVGVDKGIVVAFFDSRRGCGFCLVAVGLWLVWLYHPMAVAVAFVKWVLVYGWCG